MGKLLKLLGLVSKVTDSDCTRWRFGWGELTWYNEWSEHFYLLEHLESKDPGFEEKHSISFKIGKLFIDINLWGKAVQYQDDEDYCWTGFWFDGNCDDLALYWRGLSLRIDFPWAWSFYDKHVTHEFKPFKMKDAKGKEIAVQGFVEKTIFRRNFLKFFHIGWLDRENYDLSYNFYGECADSSKRNGVRSGAIRLLTKDECPEHAVCRALGV